MKHTPGPWTFSNDRFNACPDVKPDGVLGSILSEDEWFIAEVWADAGDDDSEPEANARLIAAAPDMLEALRGIQAQCAGHCDEFSLRVCVVANTAIAKAEGKLIECS